MSVNKSKHINNLTSHYVCHNVIGPMALFLDQPNNHYDEDHFLCNPPLSSTKPQFNNNPFLSFSVNSATQLLKKQIKSQENKLCCLSESVARTSLLALVSASLFFVDPVLA
ncbi:hypothetical protein LWI29_011391 [Acer saccharum]|uniref:Uncharacterized protein n=1 Tax=Acer saccharum TaxID=4024 RepID=A0AA39SLY1_ACESA|nr:hypothetical protein LWI29_011391 [Acer saccharum]